METTFYLVSVKVHNGPLIPVAVYRIKQNADVAAQNASQLPWIDYVEVHVIVGYE